MSEIATHCYVGCASCGCQVASVVDMPDHKDDTAESVAEFIADGLTIERMTIEEFRERGGWGHKCGKDDPR